MVLEDLSSGEEINLQQHNNLQIRKADLSERENAVKNIEGAEVVFHLATIHGGQGFIKTFQKLMLVNMTIDNNVFNAPLKTKTSMVVHASSACAYRIKTQSSTS